MCEVCVRVLTHLTNVLKTNSVSFTVDGKSLFKTRVFLMHISCSFRLVSGRGRETNHKHKSKINILLFSLSFNTQSQNKTQTAHAMRWRSV